MTDENTLAVDVPLAVERPLAVEEYGALTVVTLQRPQRRNTIDLETCRELTAFLLGADRDKAVRALVITGAGKDFCTGADVVAGKGDQIAALATLDYRYATVDFQALFQRLWEMETPVVSAVNGAVAGAGWMLALLADLVVAAEGARWTHVFARRGMVPHAGDPFFLPRVIPFHRLNEIALLSEPVTSDTLHGWGIVNRCVPQAEVLPTALELGQRLAEGPTRALGLAKRLYRRSLESDMATAFAEERAAQALISTTHDRREGVQSFVEQRPARFVGD